METLNNICWLYNNLDYRFWVTLDGGWRNELSRNAFVQLSCCWFVASHRYWIKWSDKNLCLLLCQNPNISPFNFQKINHRPLSYLLQFVLLNCILVGIHGNVKRQITNVVFYLESPLSNIFDVSKIIMDDN